MSISMDNNLLRFGNNYRESSTELVITMSEMAIWPDFVSFKYQEGLQTLWGHQKNVAYNQLSEQSILILY